MEFLVDKSEIIKAYELRFDRDVLTQEEIDNIKIEQEEAKEFWSKYITRLGNLWDNRNGISNQEFMNFFARAIESGETIWYGKTADMTPMQDFIIKELGKENKAFKGRDSNFFKESKKVLNELQNAGLISWKVVTPEWAKASFIEVKVLDRKGLLSHKGSRFQKVLESESDKPKNIDEVTDKV